MTKIKKEYLLYTSKIISLLAFIIIQSCGNTKNNVSFSIPNDVSVVLCFNLSEMSNKSSLLKSTLGKDLFDNLEQDVEIFANILSADINFNTEIFFFGKVDRDLSKSYWALTFGINNAQSFETALKKSKENFEVEKKDKQKIITFHEDAILTWNDRQALLLVSPDMGGKDALFKMCQEIYQNKKSLKSENKVYQQLLQQKYDIAYWLDIRAFMDSGKSEKTNYWLDFVGLQGIYQKYNSSFTELASVINFENGNLITDTELFVDVKKIEDLKKLLDKKGINKNLTQKIPIKNPILLFSTSLNTKELYETFEKSNTIKSESLSDIIAEDLVDILSGEFIVGVNNFEVLNSSSLDFVLGIGIKDQNKLQKHLKELEDIEGIEKKKGYYKTNLNNSYAYFSIDVPIYIIPKKDMLFIVSSEQAKNNIQKNKTVLGSNFIQSLNENNVVFFLDIEKLGKKNIPIVGFAPNLFEYLRKVNIQSKNIQNNSIKVQTTLLFDNHQQNSLTTLIKLAIHNNM